MSVRRDSMGRYGLGLAALVTVSLGGLLSCADALSITPPTDSAGGGDPTTSVAGGMGGSGGNQPVPCASNSDCPFPTTVCDLTQGLCVGCLEIADCAFMPGTVCSSGDCSCPTTGESWCEVGQCVDLAADPDNCGQCGKACFGSCIEGSCADAWEPVSTMDAPSARGGHVAEWTGTHLFVWGGTTTNNVNNNLNTGGLYDPATSEWIATSLVGAPSPRQGATSVWTGTHVLVWGGQDGSAVYFNDGAAYDPATNTWSPLAASSLTTRVNHTAVWTGALMVVWGGHDDANAQLNSGGVYDMAGDSWSATSALASPAAARERHTAVWAGTEMWLYGGFGDSTVLGITNEYFPAVGVDGGLRYDPVLNAWDTLPATGQPSARDSHTMVFDGTYAIVFGGWNGTDETDLGYRVDGSAIQWEAVGGTQPLERRDHTAVWLADANAMIVWGGRNAMSGVLGSGAIYAGGTNQWTATTPTALAARTRHKAVSTGDRMIVWGGFNSSNTPLGDGGIYTP